RLPVGSDQNAILVVPERRGPQPHSALAVVYVAASPQSLDRARHLPRVVKGPLREPRVEPDTEARQRLIDPVSHRGRPPPGEACQVARGHPGAGQLLREFADVLTGVAVLGRLTPLHPSGDRLGEPAYLAADVVQQVLPLDVMSPQLEEPSERVPV